MFKAPIFEHFVLCIVKQSNFPGMKVETLYLQYKTSKKKRKYTASRLQQVRLQRAPIYNEQIPLHQNYWQQCDPV